MGWRKVLDIRQMSVYLRETVCLGYFIFEQLGVLFVHIAFQRPPYIKIMPCVDPHAASERSNWEEEPFQMVHQQKF